MDTVDTTEQRPQRRRRGILVFLLMVTSLATVGATAMSLALFTDSDATVGAFSTGTIDIALDDATVFNVPAMMPGDEVEQTLKVANNGTAEFRYAMTAAPSSPTADDDGLGGEIQLTISEGACGTSGDVLYTGDLNAAYIGDATPAGDPGDRTLAASGGAEDLCFYAILPDTTGPGFQGDSTSITFTFDAEQTANN